MYFRLDVVIEGLPMHRRAKPLRMILPSSGDVYFTAPFIAGHSINQYQKEVVKRGVRG